MTALRLLAALSIAVAALPLVQGASWTVSTTPSFAWSPSSLTIAAGDTVTFGGGGTHDWRNEGGVFANCVPLGTGCSKTYTAAGTYPFYCSVHDVVTTTGRSGMVGVVQVGAVATSVTVSPPGTVQGLASFSGTVSDPGAAISKVEVRLGTASTPFVPATLDGSGGWTATIDVSGMANTNYPLLVQAYAASGAFARASAMVTVANPPYVDLTIFGLTGQVGQATTASINVQYRNAGNTASGPYSIVLEYLYKDEWRPITTLNIPGTNAFMNAQSTVGWNSNANLVGQFPIRAIVDPANLKVESNEANNMRSATAGFVSALIPGQDVRDPDV